MKKILGLMAVVLLIGGTAFAANTSQIDFKLEINGDNHAADYETVLGPPPQFTPGQTSLLNLAQGVDTVSWDVRVIASGMVDDVALLPVIGVANVVFTLELYDSGNNLVQIGAATMACATGAIDVDCTNAQPTTAGFYSSIQDGDLDGVRGLTEHQLAAFAFSFRADGAGNYARVWDKAVGSNGPDLARKQYPSAAGFPAASTADLGKLVGMGAGYEQYQGLFSGVGDYQTGGVGLDGLPGDCVLSTAPIAEGQISLIGLDQGTYTLKVVPGQGNNVLGAQGVDCLAGTTGRFATAAATTATGATVQFIYNPININPPVLASAVSVKNHGLAGNLGMAIGLGGTVTSEPRNGGPTQIVCTYDKAIGGTIAVTQNGVALPAGQVVAAGTTLTITPNAVADKTCVALAISGVADAANLTAVAAPYTLKVRARKADVNNDGQVNSADVLAVRQKNGFPNVTAANCQYDLNLSSKCGSDDTLLCRQLNVFGSTACTYP